MARRSLICLLSTSHQHVLGCWARGHDGWAPGQRPEGGARAARGGSPGLRGRGCGAGAETRPHYLVMSTFTDCCNVTERCPSSPPCRATLATSHNPHHSLQNTDLTLGDTGNLPSSLTLLNLQSENEQLITSSSHHFGGSLSPLTAATACGSVMCSLCLISGMRAQHSWPLAATHVSTILHLLSAVLRSTHSTHSWTGLATRRLVVD